MTDGAPSRIRTLDKAMDLIEVLASHSQGLSLSALARLTGHNSSSLHHLLATLKSRGFVDQDPKSREYRLGYRLVSLTHEYVNDSDIYRAGVGHIRELRNASKANALLTVLRDREKFVVFEAPGEQPVQTRRTHLSGPTQLHANASGKTLLAHLPQEEAEAVIRAGPLTRYTMSTVVDPDQLLAELQGVRDSGFALDQEEWLVGLFGIAAPIFDHQDNCVATASVAFPAVQVERRHENTRLVVDCAARISAALGHVSSRSSRAREGKIEAAKGSR